MDDNFEDVEYEEVPRTIRGKMLFYTNAQVSELLGIAPSKLSYYRDTFKNILKIRISNKHHRYTERDIEKLRFMLELKEKGMTMKQIGEYCSEVSFEEDKGVQIKETNPLSIKTLAEALMNEQQKQLKIFSEENHKQLLEFKENFKREVIDAITYNNNNLQEIMLEHVSTTIDEVMDNKLTGVIENQREIKELHQHNQHDLKEYIAVTIDNMEQEVTRKLVEREDVLKANMEERKLFQKKKSWWDIITRK